jgi:hypothetical protein
MHFDTMNHPLLDELRSTKLSFDGIAVLETHDLDGFASRRCTEKAA